MSIIAQHEPVRSSSRTDQMTSGNPISNIVTPMYGQDDDEQDRTNISQLYNLNTVSSRILDDTADGMPASAPWMGMSAQGPLRSKNYTTSHQQQTGLPTNGQQVRVKSPPLHERRANNIQVPAINVKAMQIDDSGSHNEPSSANTIMAKTKKVKPQKKFPIQDVPSSMHTLANLQSAADH